MDLTFYMGQPLVQIHLLYKLMKLNMKLVVAFVAPRSKVFHYFVSMLHRPPAQQNYIKSQMSSMELKEMTRRRVPTLTPTSDRWYDVQDENGVWRVGQCEKKSAFYKLISLDGFHPSYTSFYCDHSGKILPVRTMTMGLTVPQDKTMRQVLKAKDIDQVCGKMSLYQLMTDQLENTPEKIRLFIRTELLICIDKVFTTPFQILATVKRIDVDINKLFMYTIEYYFKLLESSKRFIALLDSNQTAMELYKSTYEMAHIIQMLLGVHKRSRAFYDSSFNRTIKCDGIMDYFMKCEGGGPKPFRLFFKNLSTLKNIEKDDLIICLETVYLFISICEKYQGEFIEGKSQSLTITILDEIINLIKAFCDKSNEIANEFKGKIELISRIETLYFKLLNKECSLRKFVMRDREKETQTIKELVTQKQTITRMKSDWQLSILGAGMKSPGREWRDKDKDRERNKPKDNEKIKELENKLAQLEQKFNKMQAISIHDQQVIVQSKKFQPSKQPTENLGEEAFLGSLQWALDAGDIATCKQLVTWRKSLLKLGRITGWEIALAVGMKTFRSKQIKPEDIIEANYQFIMKNSGSGEDEPL